VWRSRANLPVGRMAHGARSLKYLSVMTSLPVLTPQQSRDRDAAAIAAGASDRVLMENAGRAVAQLTTERFAQAAAQGVLIACGPGNNGGDGWVTARALRAMGIAVWATEIAEPRDGPAFDARAAALRDGVGVVPADGPWPAAGLIIDALLGTGAHGAPSDDMMALLHRVVDAQRPVIAIDGPTGLDLATGVHHGTLRASLSVTFGGVRRGHLLGRDEVGDLVVVDIGLPAPDPSWPTLVDPCWAAGSLPRFQAAAYKGTRGRVVIVGGSVAMVGAARLAARGAFAAGAGLVHVIAPEAALAVLRTAEPDVQTAAQEFSGKLSDRVAELIAHADVVAIGPGLGRDAGRAAFVLEVLTLARSAVVDADALTVLRTAREELARFAASRSIVCTPHVGEFGTLFPEFAINLETAPWDAALGASHASGALVLLKGVPTVIAAPDGRILTVAAGNPGLATGGSGDILTGIIAALVGQGVRPFHAAAIGAQAHGDAADIAARRVTARAMRPMDVITALPDLWRAWARPFPMHRAPILRELPAPINV
jgi:ADP-dependent NAD(P)H-hydrate dehydratase / NAD(P)H-hydrate epimerase